MINIINEQQIEISELKQKIAEFKKQTNFNMKDTKSSSTQTEEKSAKIQINGKYQVTDISKKNDMNNKKSISTQTDDKKCNLKESSLIGKTRESTENNDKDRNKKTMTKNVTVNSKGTKSFIKIKNNIQLNVMQDSEVLDQNKGTKHTNVNLNIYAPVARITDVPARCMNRENGFILLSDELGKGFIIIITGKNDFNKKQVPSFRYIDEKVKKFCNTNIIFSSVPYTKSHILNQQIYKYNFKLNKYIQKLNMVIEGNIIWKTDMESSSNVSQSNLEEKNTVKFISDIIVVPEGDSKNFLYKRRSKTITLQ